MRKILQALLLSSALAAAAATAGTALAQTAQSSGGFASVMVAREAERYETWLKANWKPGRETPASLRAAASKVLADGRDPRAASRAFALAVVADPKEPGGWIGLARSLLAVPADALAGSERYEVPLNASAAAYTAYQRAASRQAKAEALAVLGEALKRRSMWRPAIEAYRASVALVDMPEVRTAFEALKAEKGFRIAEYKVEAETQTPRVCVQFSERLSPAQADPQKFIAVDGREPQALSIEGQQLCIDGLQHGRRYEVLVRAGLAADTGDELPKQSELSIYVRDRAAAVRVSGKSYVLPSRGQQGLPITTVNMDKVAIEVLRIGDRGLLATLSGSELQRQMSQYDIEQIRSRSGQSVYKGDLAVASKLNEEVVTAVPIGEAIPELKPGIYAMVAGPAEAKSRDRDSDQAVQWFIVSDLGLAAFSGETGIHTFVRSLATAEPVAGAKVRLIARNNEVIGEARSDASGYVKFAAALRQGEGGLAPALVVAEGGSASDYAFLDLAQSAFDLSDRGVKGRDAPGPIDGFMYTDRGVYRAGEAVNVAGLVRTRDGKASSVPVTLIVTRPDGVEHARLALTDGGLGGRTHTLKLAPTAMPGTWRLKLHTDPKADPIATAGFLVEDFVPERLDMTLAPEGGAVGLDTGGRITLTGKYLYGPPAADLAIEGDIIVKASKRDLDGWPGWRFGQADEKITPVRKALEDLPRTDKDGRASVAFQMPQIPKTGRPLEADVLLRLREPGGRTIERAVTLPVTVDVARVGLKPTFKDDQVAEGTNAVFDAILLDAAGKPLPGRALNWTLVKLEQHWQWYSRDGQWAYEPVTATRKVANGEVRLGDAGTARIEGKVDWGRYRLDVVSTEAGGPAASSLFSAGWYAEESLESPEQLEVALDKPSYRVGETAKLRITSRQPGKALISVLGDGHFQHLAIDVPKGGTEAAIPVSADLAPGAYVTATLYRPMDEAQKRMPSRAIGVRWLGLDQSERKITVDMTAPAKVGSAAKLVVPVRLGGLAVGEEARVTISAVDIGILNLTRFQTPEPEAWFGAQRKLATEIRDLYGRLIDGMRADRGRLRSGGDGRGRMALQGSAPTEATLALYSGIVKVEADGTARVEFQLPDFNGAVRLNAVAWSASRTGHGSADVIVRDAVALTASAPRFLTYGDEARLEVDLHNIELGQTALKVAVAEEHEGAAARQVVDATVQLGKGERKIERIAIKPSALGAVSYTITASGPDGLALKRRLTFDVKPPAGDIRRTVVAELKPNGGKLTISRDLLADLIPGRTEMSLAIGPTANLDLPRLLTELDRYPYGCAEQTVSRALPLLYANGLAKLAGLKPDPRLKERVQGAIDRVFEMQSSSGAFGVWGPSNADMWLTSFVTDFLGRARETGFAVSARAFTQALDRLQNFVGYAQDFEAGGEARAYALYVLARNGRAPTGELRYYVDTRLERFSTPLGRAQLGAALAMTGDRERAERAFRAALELMAKPEGSGYRADYGSTLRDGAAVIALASETRVLKEDAVRLRSVLATALAGRTRTSTQEQAWLLLAANALADEAANASVAIGGVEQKGSIARALLPSEIGDGGLVIANTGDASLDAVVSVLGASLTPEPAIAKGLGVTRSYYTLDGKPVDLKSATGGEGRLVQSDRLVVVLKIDPPADGGRLLLVDRLPAGLEIENPKLVDSGDIKSLAWLKSAVRPDHTEFRDDRFVAAFTIRPKGTRGSDAEQADDSGDQAEDDTAAQKPADGKADQKPVILAAYIVRAVTPGRFAHPAAVLEDMYRPERFARTGAGRLEIVGK